MTEKHIIKLGSIVIDVTSGRAMGVNRIKKNDDGTFEYRCIWIDEMGEMGFGNFTIDQIEHIRHTSPFFVSDVVKLMSGGPKMTVVDQRPYAADPSITKVDCIWMDVDGRLQKEMFRHDILQYASEGDEE